MELWGELEKKGLWLLKFQLVIYRSIDRVASSQLLFDKTCYNDFNFTDEICNDLQQHKENETSVGVSGVKKYKVVHHHKSRMRWPSFKSMKALWIISFLSFAHSFLDLGVTPLGANTCSTFTFS